MKERTDKMKSPRTKAMLRGVLGGFTAPLMIFPIVTQLPSDPRPRSNVEESFRQTGLALRHAVKKYRSHEPA